MNVFSGSGDIGYCEVVVMLHCLWGLHGIAVGHATGTRGRAVGGLALLAVTCRNIHPKPCRFGADVNTLMLTFPNTKGCILMGQ